MKTILNVILAFLFSVQIAYSLDTNAIKYMPLQVGNKWIYDCSSNSYSGSTHWTEILQVFFSRNINAHKYFYLNSNFGYIYTGYYRVDSITGSMYKYDSTGSCSNYHFEILIDSLAAIVGDTIRNCGSGTFKCTEKINVILFGDSTMKKSYYKTFSNPPYSGNESKSFVSKFGRSYMHNFIVGPQVNSSSNFNLKGCIINGIVYGDTSTTYINQISNRIPESYSLNQNYPNPFNPSTTIRYSVKRETLNVKLVVYDILGKEITTLVNEKQKPGEYEVTYNANDLPSGVYIYSLYADGKRIDTKKLVLLK